MRSLKRRYRVKALFSKTKWPGWVLVLLAVFKGVPDQVDTWKTRIEFWQEAAKQVGDNVTLITWIVASPWFGFGLLLLGIAYLIFVGEESKSKLRHPIWPLLGWTIVGVVFLAFWSVLVAGYVADRVDQRETEEAETRMTSLSQDLDQMKEANKKLEDKVVSLQKQQQPWGVTDEQKRKLTAALNKVPTGTIYQLRIFYPDRCEQCGDYAEDLGEAWHDISGWEVRAIGSYILRARQQGVFVAVDMAGCPPEALVLIMGALDAAEVKYEKSTTEGKMGADSCVVIVTNRPAG